MGELIELHGLKKVVAIILFMIYLYFLTQYTGASFLSMLVVHVIVIYFFVIMFKKFDLNYQRFFTGCFYIKYLLLVYDSYHKKLPLTSGDFTVFHYAANEFLTQVNHVYEVWYAETGNDFFIRFVAFIYGIFGSNIPQIYFYVFATSMVLIYMLFLLAKEMTNSTKLAQWVVLAYMLMPVAIIYNITYLRETHIQLFFVSSMYFLVCFIKQKSYFSMGLAIMFAIFASSTHSGMVVQVALCLLVLTLYSSTKKRLVLNPVRIAILAIIGLGVMMSPLWDQIAGRFANLESLDDVVDKTSVVVQANTTYTTLKAENSVQFILYTPIKAVLFAITPLPWHVRSFGTLISWIIDAVPKTIILGLVTYYFFKYRDSKNEYDVIYHQLFFVIMILFYFMYGNGTEAYGTAIRHRSKILPLELIMATFVVQSSYFKIRFICKKN